MSKINVILGRFYKGREANVSDCLNLVADELHSYVTDGKKQFLPSVWRFWLVAHGMK